MQTDPPRVLQMRLVVEADGFGERVRFSHDVLGLSPAGLAERDPSDARIFAPSSTADRPTLGVGNFTERRFIRRGPGQQAKSAPERMGVAGKVTDS